MCKMKNLIKISLISLILISASCSGPKKTSDASRILSVENGLVPYNWKEKLTAWQVIDPVRIDSLPKFTIEQRMKEWVIPGCGIAVIEDFKIAWTKGYGVMEAGTDKKVTPETMFQSGSTTKILMAIAVLRMVEEGKLDLDTDVNTYLKSWKMPEHPSGIKVTLRMLLTHQAGINRPGSGTENEEGTEPTLVQFLKGEKPVLSDSVFFDNTPGTVHSYSNFGYMIMQLVLEDLLNSSYTQIVQQYIFDPLELTSSLIEYPFPARFKDRIIRPHSKTGVPSPTDGLNSGPLAQAGMVTTPSDWARIACEIMLAKQGKTSKIISKKSVEMMFTIERELNPAEFEGLTGQGLGVFRFGKENNQFFIHHGHNNPGANCLLLASTTTGQGVVVMTNGMYGLDLALEILASVSKEYQWIQPD
jgi:CubicO group peptidase (beta-lactamase class C family)